MLGLTIVGRGASTTVIGGANTCGTMGSESSVRWFYYRRHRARAANRFDAGNRARRFARASAKWVGRLMRHHPTTRIWSMIEVMMVGVLVALVKIADYATVIPGIALFVLWVLVFVLAGMQASFDPGRFGRGSDGLTTTRKAPPSPTRRPRVFRESGCNHWHAAWPAKLRRLRFAFASDAGLCRRTMPALRRGVEFANASASSGRGHT